MEMNVEETIVLGIWSQPSIAQIMADQKQLENVNYFNYLGRMIANDVKSFDVLKLVL